MDDITLDTEARQVSAELARRGIAAATRVRVVAEAPEHADALPTAAVVQVGGALDWLAEEPDLYSDVDLAPPPVARR